jgi:DNA-directed RNA polymerase sigma subunit (sigma70/sigma32)
MPRVLSINTEGVIEWRREDADFGEELKRRDEQIRERHGDGMSIKELAAEFKLSDERIRQIVKQED